jgi:hypothetical protein
MNLCSTPQLGEQLRQCGEQLRQHLVFGSRTGYALSRDVSPSMRSEPSSFHDLGSRVTAEGSRRSKIIDRASVSARTRHLLGLLLPHHQLELVALRVGERGLRHTKRHTARADRRELDLVERPGAQAAQPLDLLVVVVGDQDKMDAVLGRPGLGGIVENHPGAAFGAGGVDCRVPGDRARADRAAEGLSPEVRQGGGIGAVDGQGCDTQTDSGGHDFFLFLLCSCLPPSGRH